MDTDGSGELSIEDVLAGYYTNEPFFHAMQSIGVPKRDLGVIFEILDPDQSGYVSYAEFVDRMHYLQCADDHLLAIVIRHHAENIRRRLEDMASTHHEFERKLVMLRREIKDSRSS